MYLDYWQLESKPFEPALQASFVIPSPARQAALHKLRYAIENRRPAAVLAGLPGVGKTLLVDSLADEIAAPYGPFVHVVFPQMSERDLLVFLAEQLGAPQADPPRHTVEESLRRLEFILGENERRGRHAVVVVDEAHLLEDSGLIEPLRLLLNLTGAQRQNLFTLLLVGQPTTLPMLQRYGAFDQRIDVKALLPPLSESETARYVLGRLHAAGATREIFTEEALLVAHQLSGGIARRLNRLCDLALLVAYAEQREVIDSPQLQAVSDELVTLAA